MACEDREGGKTLSMDQGNQEFRYNKDRYILHLAKRIRPYHPEEGGDPLIPQSQLANKMDSYRQQQMH